MTTGKFSLSDRLYTFGVWVTQVDCCIRLLREYKEEGRTFDMQAFLNHNLSCGMNDQFSEMKKMWNSFAEEQPEWYSFQKLERDKVELEELAGMSLS
ncbi:hypothetical protein ACH0DO_002694 [Enterococcus hirae]